LFRVIFLVSVGIVAISFASIFIKFCNDVPSIMIATYRLTISSVIILTIAKIKGIRFSHFTKKQLALAIMGGLFLSLHFSFWISSLKFTSVASSVVLVTTNPVIIGIFSYFFLREKQPREVVLGIILSFSGSFILAIGDSGIQGLTIKNSSYLIGDLLAFLGAVMASGYLMIGSILRKDIDILSYTSLVYTFSALILLMASIYLRIPFTGYNPTSYMYLLLLAIIPQLIGHTALNWALKHLRTNMVAITILGEPIGASFLAYLLFGETIKPIQSVGIILIFLAIFISSKKGKRPSLSKSQI